MIFTTLYLICFALLLVGAFSLMSQGFRMANQPMANSSSGRGDGVRPTRHPEAPEPGEVVMVVDLNRERLEQLYQQSS
ncbi:MAG: DUF2973 domain-containing protein [Cyanobium sp. PLM2.Bin73]|nr:MAG: DUF2973 domain-containing protein [Cyanobium sp. PLM2.Bin73]